MTFTLRYVDACRSTVLRRRRRPIANVQSVTSNSPTLLQQLGNG